MISFCFNNELTNDFLQKADLAIADLTITYEREQAVDFTMPFMNLGKLYFPLFYFSCHLAMSCRSQYPLQEANKEASQFVFIPISALFGCLDIHGHCISGGFCLTFHLGKVSVCMFPNYFLLLYSSFAIAGSVLMNGIILILAEPSQTFWSMTFLSSTPCGSL